MWGNAHEATDLEPNHPLGKLLFQLSHPKSIPYDSGSSNDKQQQQQQQFWSKLFQHYGLLVHLDPQAWSSSSNGGSGGGNPVVSTACNAMCRNASKSHNLAALTLHGARMVRELQIAYLEYNQQKVQQHTKNVEDDNNKNNKMEISLIGKARVTCGVLNLLRIFCHSVIISACQDEEDIITDEIDSTTSNDNFNSNMSLSSKRLDEIFFYPSDNLINSRQHNNVRSSSSSATSTGVNNSTDGTSNTNQSQDPNATSITLDVIQGQPNIATDSAMELISALVLFLSSIRDVPSALYDTIVMSLSLLLVLLSTQLYQPMISSYEHMLIIIESQQKQKQQQPNVDDNDNHNNNWSGRKSSSNDINNRHGMGNHYFLDKLLYGAYECRLKLRREQQQQQQIMFQEDGNSSSTTNYHQTSKYVNYNNNDNTTSSNGHTINSSSSYDLAQTLLMSLLHWTTNQPLPPDGKSYKSISYHHTELVRALVQSKSGLKPDPNDGLYWGHPSIVVSSKRPARLAHEQQQQQLQKRNTSSIDRTLSNSSTSSATGNTTQILSTTTRQRIMGSSNSIVQAATFGVMMASSTILLFPFRLVKLAFHVFGSIAFAKSGGNLSTYPPTEDDLNCLHSLAHDHGSGCNNSRRPVTNDVIWISDSPIADMAGCLLLLLTHNFRAKDVSATTTDMSSSWNDNNNAENGTSNDQQQQQDILESSYYQEQQQQQQQQHEEEYNRYDYYDQDKNDTSYTSSRIFPNEFLLTLATLQDNRWEGNNTSSSFISTTAPNIDVFNTLRDKDNADDDDDEFLTSTSLDIGGQSFGWNNISQHASFTTGGIVDGAAFSQLQPTLSMNFERLFETFGDIVHTELGALLLYTLLQTSPKFAASISARSDLDTLVMPLLKTLYFSLSMPISEETTVTSSLGLGGSTNRSSKRRNNTNNNNNNNGTFRSPNQLYVILILLLLFSQDSSFGSDAFRRINIPSISWYKERTLKDISLGSVLVLVLLRSLTFNLNRLQDAFLLTNCCAVLLNLAPHIKDLHSYASMRLASVTLTCMKKFITFVKASSSSSSSSIDDIQNDLTSIPGMYGEASRSLLQVIGQCLQPQVLAKNLHLLYALVYLQSDLQMIMKNNGKQFFNTEIDELNDINVMVEEARCIICENGTHTQTAIQAMSSLDHNIRRLLRVYHTGATSTTTGTSSVSPSSSIVAPSSPSSRDSSIRSSSNASDSFMATSNDLSITNATNNKGEDFSFTYEEEPDPEPFFIPYIWDVTICACTASYIEWEKTKVLVFPLQNHNNISGSGRFDDSTQYSKDVMDVV